MTKFEIKQYYTGGNMIDNILKRSNIEDMELYLNPTEDSLRSPYSYKMMAEGVELLYEAMTDNSKIGILVDCDVDGYTSAAIVYRAIQDLHSQEIQIFHHSGKQHGLSKEIYNSVVSTDIDLLIIPDAGSNDHKKREALFASGITTLVIDHHIIEDEDRLTGGSKYTINNQRSDNVNGNTHLVGAGVSLKFAEVLYERFGKKYNKEYYDLAALGQIADMSDLTDPEVRFIVSHGLRNITSKMFQTIVDERVESLKNDSQDALYPIDISFMVAPLINAVTRVGEQHEKELLFNCFTEDSGLLEERYYVARRRKIRGKFTDVTMNWTPYEYAYDIISNVKNRQDNLVKRIESDLLEEINNENGVAISILEGLEDGDEAIVGLVANRLASRFEKPTLVLRENGDDCLTGSARGYEDSNIENFKSFILETGYADFALGHENAFGSQFTKNNLNKFNDFVAKNVKEVERDDTIIYVDKIEANVDTSRVKYGHYLRALTNQDVEDVLYGYEGIRINTDFVRSRGSVTTIWESGLEYIIFNDYGKTEEKLKSTGNKFVNIDVVGKPTMNYWMGKGKPQIVVEKIQLSK